MVAERIKGFVALAGFAPLCRRRRRSHGIGNAVANFRPGKLLVTRGIRYAKVDIFVRAAVGVISLPPSIVAVLRAHWRSQLESRIALGLGKPDATRWYLRDWHTRRKANAYKALTP
jgi:hypothetical protein